jgi:hypothetical protein
MIKKLLPWNKSILIVTAFLLAVFSGGYAPVSAYGTTGANINTRILVKHYSGCESLAAGFEKSFSSASVRQSYFATSNTGAARMAYTPKIANPLPLNPALTATVCEYKAGAFRGTVNFNNTNSGLILAGKNITYDIPDLKFKAISQAVGLNSKTADAGIINVAYNIRYTPGRSVSGNRQAGGRVSVVGKHGLVNTRQDTFPLKIHTRTLGKPAQQIRKFDFTDYRSACRVPLFCA